MRADGKACFESARNKAHGSDNVPTSDKTIHAARSDWRDTLSKGACNQPETAVEKCWLWTQQSWIDRAVASLS